MAAETNERVCMEMGKAVTDRVPTPVDEDVWTQVTKHGSGNQRGPVSVTNRSIIYRLRPADAEPFLVLLNGVWEDAEADQPFKGLRALEGQTSAKLRYILSPGAAHHLSLAAYAQAFPDAKVCVAAGRIPRMNPDLVALDNVVVYPVDAPPAELAAAGLKILVVKGLMEGQKTIRIQKMSGGGSGYVPNSTEPLIVLHEPTGSITSGGHQWWFTPEGLNGVFAMPWIMKMIMKMMGMSFAFLRSGKIALETNDSFAVVDRGMLQASSKDVMSWELDRVLDLHAPPNTNPLSGGRTIFGEALAPIVEGRGDDVPWRDSQLPI